MVPYYVTKKRIICGQSCHFDRREKSLKRYFNGSTQIGGVDEQFRLPKIETWDLAPDSPIPDSPIP
jgi:hypothetical protein